MFRLLIFMQLTLLYYEIELVDDGGAIYPLETIRSIINNVASQ